MKTPRAQSGFTLIELIIVIVILGILAAIALPKFLNLQRDARIAQLAAMEGSMKAAAAIVYGKALATGADTASADVTFPINADGVTSVTLDFGYPEGGTANGIAQVVDYSTGDWTVTHTATGNTTTFQWKNVANCKVDYVSPAAANSRPTITVTKSGC
ncbi:MAG: prepilin-type N-terminal cleavage/methylation domain-containing protein [Halothiobacillaceae bacterium]